MQSLAAACHYEESIKRSRFIAHAAPVSSQAETLEFYESVADPGATHNCWAWCLDGVRRFNDDGEPGGTAGRPILAVIEGRHLDRVMLVVTRYFGGIKLGVGGLVRAYSACAAKCLDGGAFTDVHKRLNFRLTVDYELVDIAHRLLAAHDAVKTDEIYTTDGLILKFEMDENQSGPLRDALREASRGRARLSACN